MARKKRRTGAKRRKPQKPSPARAPEQTPPAAPKPAPEPKEPRSGLQEPRRKRVVLMDLPYGRIRQWEFGLRRWRGLKVLAAVLVAASLMGFAFGLYGLWHWQTLRALKQQNHELRRELEKTVALKQELQRVEQLRRRILYLMGALSDTSDSAVLLAMARQMDSTEARPRGWPAHGLVTRQFSDLHPGMDIACPVGTPVRATAPGLVAYAGADSLYGKLIILKHPGGYETLYGHLSRILVVPGWRVRRGDIIGFSGNTGISTGPHLHYAIRRQSRYLNPLPFVKDTLTP